MIAQGFGIIGMALAIYSFQCKRNKWFFVFQALSGLMFSLNFLLLPVPALGAALFNLTNIVRGALFSKSDRVKWKLILNLVLYTGCTLVGLYFVRGDGLQIFLNLLTSAACMAGTVAMWTGNGAFIRKMQFFCCSPFWLVHNCFNFSLGGILCESFNMLSVVISFLRYGKDGFEK